MSSALIGGDLLVRATEPFSQQAWDNVWSDAQRGEPILARTNVKDYPIKLASNGAITERWLIKFITSTQLELYGERLGLVAKSDTLTDLAPTNPATGKPYFTLKAAAFGGGWSAQNCIRYLRHAVARLDFAQCPAFAGQAKRPRWFYRMFARQYRG